MSIIFLVGAIQAFFLALVCFSNKNVVQADKFFRIWILFIGVQLMIVYVSTTGFYREYPQYFSYSVAFSLLEGPLLYIYVLLAIDRVQKLKPLFLLHAIPFLFFTLYFSYAINFPVVPDRYVHIMKIFHDSSNVIVQIFRAFYPLHLVIYLILSFWVFRGYSRKLSEEFSYTEGINLAWLKNVIYGMTAISIIILVGVIGHDVLLFATISLKIKMIYLAYSVLPFYLFFFAIRKKIIYPHFQDETSGSKYESSGLSRDESRNLAQALFKLMQEKKPYLDPKLSLKDLSTELNIHPKRLSQVINENFNQNFFNFINNYRIEEFKKRVGDKKFDHYTLLSIGLDCGFNTKSSFNSIFKKSTGMTPSEYKLKLSDG